MFYILFVWCSIEIILTHVNLLQQKIQSYFPFHILKDKFTDFKGTFELSSLQFS